MNETIARGCKGRVGCSLVLAAVLSLSACGSSNPETHYYVLDAVPGKALAEAALPVPAVAIRQVEIPIYLDRPNIVSRGADNRLHLSENNQWGGHLRENLTRALIDNLSQRLDSAAVIAAPFPGATEAEVSLLVEVRQFERLPDGHVHLRAFWKLNASEKVTSEHIEELVSPASLGESDYTAMATAMNGLLGALADRMASAIVATSRASGPAGPAGNGD